MKTFKKPNGVIVSIDDDGCASVNTPKGKAMLWNPSGKRERATWNHIVLPRCIAEKCNCPKGIVMYLAGSSCSCGYCTLTDGLEAWLDENWEVTKTTLEKWEELRPADAKLISKSLAQTQSL